MTYQFYQSQDGSILIGSRAGLSDISIEIIGVGQELALPVDGSILNAGSFHRLPKGSSLSFDVEDNEGNVEPQVSSWGSTPPSATAALGQDKVLASPPAPHSQDQGSASHRPTEDGRANDEAEEEWKGEPAELEPRPGSESAIEHIRLQLWDRRPAPVPSVRLIVGTQTCGRSNQIAKHALTPRSALGNVATMAIIFYDSEATGLETAFDQILQFAAIKTDDDLNELDRLDIRCRQISCRDGFSNWDLLHCAHNIQCHLEHRVP